MFGFGAKFFKNINRYHSEWGTVFDGCLKGLGLLSPVMNLCNVARGRIDAFIDFGAVWKDRLQEVIFFKKPEGSYQTTIAARGIIMRLELLAANGHLEVMK